mgnify:CR=1 FL=1
MSLLDYFRFEYVTGKVPDKYRLENGNIAAVIEDQAGKERYHVEFRDSYKGPAPEKSVRDRKGAIRRQNRLPGQVA